MWQEIPVGGGVVRTRKQNSLDIGEWRQMTNCRYKRGDLRQIHNDWGRTNIQTFSGETVVGLWYLAYESADDKLLAVTTDGTTNSYLKTGDPDSGSFSSIQTITGVVTAAGVAHRGNEYFVGTDQGNYVINENSSRAMGMNDNPATDVDTSWFTATEAGSGNSGYQANDRLIYFATEYDSTNDIESALMLFDTGSGEGEWLNGYVKIVTDDRNVTLDWSSWSKVNSNADYLRIYKAFLGNYPDDYDALRAADRLREWERLKNYPAGASLIAEVLFSAGTYTDTGSGYYGGGTPFPLIQLDAVFGGPIFQTLGYPGNFTLAAVFNDSLVTNAPSTSKQIIRYSPPGQPEYQPTPYFMYFATEQSDEIVGMHVINNRLVVLLKGGTWRVNYLPFEGNVAANQGRVQEPISRKVGCVGREAHTTVETEQGEFVCWVSQRGLEMSNGLGWTDACPDWSSAEVSGTLSQVVLENNPVASRLELYDGTTRWDFYYDPTLLKNGRFRLTGPHTHPVSVRFADANQTNMFTASTTKVYKEQVNQNSTDTILETGYIQGQSRFSDMTCDGVAMTHDAMASTTATARVYGKLQGEVEGGGTPSAIPTAFMALDETSDVRVAEMGTYLRLHMTLSGSDDWSVGPLEMDLKVTEGGNG